LIAKVESNSKFR